jgi:hypothetical protein
MDPGERETRPALAALWSSGGSHGAEVFPERCPAEQRAAGLSSDAVYSASRRAIVADVTSPHRAWPRASLRWRGRGRRGREQVKMRRERP